MTELVFIRHGQTDYNVQLRFQGHVDAPLNGHGHHQARLLAQRLAGEPARAMVSSDLTRARQTAAPLAAAWALEPVLMPALREQCFGVLEGLDRPEIERRHPELWARWCEYRADYALPGGESLREFHRRVLDAVRQLADQAAGARLVVVTHGGVLDVLWRQAQGLPLDGPRLCDIPNTGINRLRWIDGTLQIDGWADAAHLEALPPDAAALGERPHRSQ